MFPSPDTAGAIRALKKVYDLRRLQPGTEIFLQLQPPAAKKGAETLLSIDFIADGDVEISVLRNGPQSFAAKRFDRTLVPKVSYGRGVVRSSLYVAGKDAKIPAAILANLVGLYSFDVDFQRDVQPGDSFEVLYERLTDEAGEPVREGDIVVASMTLTGSTTTLYRFKTKTGFSDYFDENGQSAQKSLLRTPTDAARISSGFGRRKTSDPWIQPDASRHRLRSAARHTGLCRGRRRDRESRLGRGLRPLHPHPAITATTRLPTRISAASPPA